VHAQTLPIATENFGEASNVNYPNRSLQRNYQKNEVGDCFNAENKLVLCASE